MYPTPNEECHCWAKLITPEDMPAGEDWASVRWEVVQVFDNNGTGEDAYRVSVPGIGPSQPLSAFEWGPRVSDYNRFAAVEND